MQLRGEIIAWHMGWALLDALFALREDAPTHSREELLAQYAARLAALQPADAAPSPPKHCRDLHCDRRPLCYTDYRPHYTDRTLSSLVLGASNWTYENNTYGEQRPLIAIHPPMHYMWAVGDWSLHYGYLDAKPHWHSEAAAAAELFVRLTVGTHNAVWLFDDGSSAINKCSFLLETDVPPSATDYAPSARRSVWPHTTAHATGVVVLHSLPSGSHVLTVKNTATLLTLLPIDGTSTAIGFNHICVLRRDEAAARRPGGRVECVGDADAGKATPPEDGGPFVQIVAGTYFSCGLSVDHSVTCWGRMSQRAPEGLFLQITAGNYHACGILIDGSIACWGQSRVVALVAASVNARSTLLASEDNYITLPVVYRQVSCGSESCCALTSDGKIQCWGARSNSSASAPGEDPSDMRFRQVSVGGDGLLCGISFPSDALRCWGRTETLDLPRGGRFTQVSVSSGRLGVCAIAADTLRVLCWGQARAFAPSFGAAAWEQVEVGATAVCGVSVESRLVCAGGNGMQLNFSRHSLVA